MVEKIIGLSKVRKIHHSPPKPIDYSMTPYHYVSFDRMETELETKEGPKTKHKAKISNKFMNSLLLTV